MSVVINKILIKEGGAYCLMLDLSKRFFVIPLSIIFDNECSNKVATTFSYFSIRRGMDYKLDFTVNMIVDWLGRKRNRSAGGINVYIKSAIERLKDSGFISLIGKPCDGKIVTATFNVDKITELCQSDKERFATIYIDELLKILKCCNVGDNDNTLNHDVLLRVFAYLRTMIYRRQSDQSATQFGDYKERKKNSPETYNCYIQEMAEELKLSPRIVSDSITILKEMELIYFEPLPRIKYDDVIWRTGHTIFCNWYKREKGKFIIGGKEYYEEEVKNRKKQLRFVSKDD